MKESKFRAYDKIDKRLIIDKQDFIPLIVTNKGVFKLDPCCEYNRWIEIEEDRFVIMEYTGLKDKNRVLIFEGDIVEYGELSFQVEILDGTTIAWRNKSASNLISYQIKESIIIGNIHDNSDL